MRRLLRHRFEPDRCIKPLGARLLYGQCRRTSVNGCPSLALDRRGRAPHEAVSRSMRLSQRLRSRLARPPSSPSGAHQRPAAGSLTGARVVPASEEGVPGTYGTRATSGSRHSREMSVLGKEGCVRVWPECGRPAAGHPALAASPRGRCRRIKVRSSCLRTRQD